MISRASSGTQFSTLFAMYMYSEVRSSMQWFNNTNHGLEFIATPFLVVAFIVCLAVEVVVESGVAGRQQLALAFGTPEHTGKVQLQTAVRLSFMCLLPYYFATATRNAKMFHSAGCTTICASSL